MNQNQTKKLRPVITSIQLSYLLDLIQNDNRSTTEQIKDDLYKYLKLFQAKVSIGIVAPSYVVQEKKRSIDDILGADDSPAANRRRAYDLYIESPQLCTPKQIHLAKTYMYENDLMTAEQEAEYEEDL